MTDIAVRETHPAATVVQAPAVDNDLMTWVNNAEKVEKIATRLADTSFVPATLRGKPIEITAALLAGMELGLPPMATLRSMDVIQGTPALRAHAMRGLVQSHGHEIELVESTPERCVMRGRRAGTEAWQTVTWTIDRAALMGLTGKSEWKKQPQTMLVARATGELCRLIASDVLYAMPYAAEELRTADADDAQVAVQAPRITLAEITGPRTPAPALTPPTPGGAPAGSWDDVEYPAPVDVESLQGSYEPAAWPTTAQPGGDQ